MQDQQVRFLDEDSDQPLVPRALPNAQFVQDLDQEIRRAARQRMEKAGIRPSVPFEEMVVELRKLVRLLRKTLIPIRPRAEFARALGQQAEMWATLEITAHQQQRRLWIVGGMVGSALSVVGVMTALLLRRRNGHNNGSSQVHAEKPAGAAW
jgi:hypothetical protein